MKRVLVGITGSIAAYKTATVVSTLAKEGNDVQVILSDRSCQFVSPLTFATLSRRPAFSDGDFWQPSHGRPLHISLGEWAEMLVIAPLSAHSLAKLALGLADNLLLNTVLASHCPIVLAPAMNTVMWQQSILQDHVKKLEEQGRFLFIRPTEGLLACDTIGTGRMAEPEMILDFLASVSITQGKQDLKGKRVLVTAGGTREYIDAVRFIGNPSTGKQGLAVAQAAWHRGAEVTLIYANGKGMEGCKTIGVTSALEMAQALGEQFPLHDWLVMTAAVGDVRPQVSFNYKVPKEELGLSLLLEPVPDLVGNLWQQKRPEQKIIGFAAQTGTDGEIIAKGKQKLFTKQLDGIVINAIDRPGSGFAGDTNSGFFLDKHDRITSYPLVSKLELGHLLLNDILRLERS